jgi:spore germination protein GerM
MRRRPLRLAAALLAGVLAAGCGIQPDSGPRRVDPPPGPFSGLASPPRAANSTGQIPEKLYMVRDGRLVEVARHVDRTPTVSSVILDLLDGPTDLERTAGLSSAVPGSDVLSAARLANGHTVVELASRIEDAGRNDSVLAYAQLVCTLMALSGVTDVTFTHGGQPIGVPRADGSLSQDPLTSADYVDLVVTG